MSTYDTIAWLPLCAGLTGLGLVLSFFVMRRRGMGSGLRAAAWALLPLAAYLTGAIKMFWRIGIAIGDFATGFVFSPRVWSGIALTGLTVVLFVVAGPLRRRARQGQDQQAEPGPAGTRPVGTTGGQLTTRPAGSLPGPGAKAPAKAPAKARKGRSAADDDDELGDVADILRRHGIT
jgi:hypothetical protein